MESFCEKKNCQELLKNFNCQHQKGAGNFLQFDHKGDLKSIFKDNSELTFYNPTKPFMENGQRMILVRVEPRNCEHSRVFLFQEDSINKWSLVNPKLNFKMQDPFYIQNIQGWKIIGGVKIGSKNDGLVEYRTVFYRYRNSILELMKDNKIIRPFAKGPVGMKDIRLIDLKNGKIGVFTRPQGGEAGLGKIGYVEISALSELEEAIPQAEIIDNLFEEGEWGGANDLMLIDNKSIGVFGHIAHSNNGIKHYYGMTFLFDRVNFIASRLRIITTAEDFEKHSPKKADLGKVVFLGGSPSHRDKELELYLGVGDVRSGRLVLTNPFIE